MQDDHLQLESDYSLMEEEIRNELRSLFELDTQTHLQTYQTVTAQLNPKTWRTDIQELYRAIHTIKGGAATVGADPVLATTTALEEMLANLRYLLTAPDLSDGVLIATLVEAGEIVSSSLLINFEEASSGQSTSASALERLQALSQQVKARFLADIDESQQRCYDFATQGFDLVVLEVEIALEELPEAAPIPQAVMDIASLVFTDLETIGNDLDIGPHWSRLLRPLFELSLEENSDQWRSRCQCYLQLLKDCALNGGTLTEAAINQLTLDGFSVASGETSQSSEQETKFTDPEERSVQAEMLAPDTVKSAGVSPPAQQTENQQTPASSVSEAAQTEPDSRKNVIPKIPVRLDQLDRSAQALVEILLSVRSTQGQYQTLLNHVSRIIRLSQESAAYITQLRQMQDDYALLEDLSQSVTDETGVQLERYRTGYTVINRLLEHSLRLSEIGAEAAATAQTTTQSFNRLNTDIKVLQSNVEACRLVPFKSVAFRLRAVVRDLINRLGKPVDFVIEGESQKLDAGTTQVIEPALLHLVRNAYDHGIEEPETRQSQQKPERATLTLSFKRQGSFYYMSIIDDGAGMDRSKISAIAERKGLPFSQTETNEQLLQVISQPGFSSQSEVSLISGRGVGMDVVQHQVQAMGGLIQLTTQLGQGTQFEMKIPVPHLLVPCTVTKAGLHQFAIPTDAIQTIRLWDETCMPMERPALDLLPWAKRFEDRLEPMMPVISYWQALPISPDIQPEKMETTVCFRVPCQPGDSSSDALWLVVDELVEEIDLLIKPLPSPLKMPIGMMGMSTLPSGEMIPVLEASAIAQTLLKSESTTLKTILGMPMQRDKEGQEKMNSRLILVVDDAALLRRRLAKSLTHYGYDVQCCCDGLEAWNWLQDHPAPRLMITDIEMPQMDGLTLVDRCRQTGHSFPILVSSSRLSEDWSQEAKRVGADQYLTKGFSTRELIESVAELIQAG